MSPPSQDKPGGLRFGREDAARLFEVVRLASRALVFRSPIPRLAAALAFRTIFGLIPVAVIGLAVLGEVVSDERLESEVSRLLAFTGITNIVIQPAPDAESDPAAEAESGVSDGDGEARGSVGETDSLGTPDDPAAIPSSPGTDPGDTDSSPAPAAQAGGQPSAQPGTRLDDWIQGTIDRIRQISLRAIGLAGAAVLIYAAIALLRDIEQSFNLIYRARRGRSWWHRFTLYWTTISLGMFMLIGVFYLGDLASKQIAVGLVSQGIVEFVIATAITTVILTLGYIGMPNTRVHVRAALTGAFLAALGWQVLKWGFALYVRNATGYGQLYGEIGLLPIFLLWVYSTWVIILFGLQVSYAVQFFSVWREQVEGDEDGAGPSIIDPHAIVALAALTAERFRSGQTLGVDDAAELLGVRASDASTLIDRLEASKHIHRVEPEDSAGFAAITLARPPEEIPIAHLLRAMGEAGSTESARDAASGDAWLDRTMGRMRDAEGRAWTDWTLARLIATDEPSGRSE